MTEYIFNRPRPSPLELNIMDKTIRDCMAGPDRMVFNAGSYLRRPEGMNTSQWVNYLRGAVYVNTPSHTLSTWCGAANRKPHVIECPVPVDFRVDHLRLNADHLIKHAIYNVLAYGRVTYYADPEGYIVHYGPQHEIRITMKDSKLSQALFQEDDAVRLELYLDADGLAAYRRTDNEGTVTDTGKRLVVEGKLIDYLPIVCLNALDLSIDRGLSPLYDICKLSIMSYDLSLQQSYALYYTATPQPVIYSNVVEEQKPKTLGPTTLWVLPMGSKAELLTYAGDGIADRRQEMARVETQMSALGASMLLNRSDKYTVARTKEMTSRASTSDLVEILKNIDDGLEVLLRFLATFKGADLNAIKVATNKDLLDVQAESNLIRSLTEAYGAGLISSDLWFRIAQAGEIIPADVKYEDDHKKIDHDAIYMKTDPEGEDNNDTAAEE